jgi:hypothetical protein
MSWYSQRIMDTSEKHASQHQRQVLGDKLKKAVLWLPIATTEMNVLRRQGTSTFIRQLLGVIGILSILVFLFTAFHTTLESSYLDLVDSLVPESGGTLIVETVNPITNGIVHSTSIPDNSCKGTQWIEEWISSGIMPDCSLANQNKVDVFYAYLFI